MVKGKSLVTLLFAAILSCNNGHQNPGIPSNAEIKFVNVGDTFSMFGNIIKFTSSKKDTAWFEYYSNGGGLKARNSYAYEFPPDTTINWGLVYLGGSSTGVAYWKIPFSKNDFWDK